MFNDFVIYFVKAFAVNMGEAFKFFFLFFGHIFHYEFACGFNAVNIALFCIAVALGS